MQSKYRCAKVFGGIVREKRNSKHFYLVFIAWNDFVDFILSFSFAYIESDFKFSVIVSYLIWFLLHYYSLFFYYFHLELGHGLNRAHATATYEMQCFQRNFCFVDITITIYNLFFFVYVEKQNKATTTTTTTANEYWVASIIVRACVTLPCSVFFVNPISIACDLKTCVDHREKKTKTHEAHTILLTLSLSTSTKFNFLSDFIWICRKLSYITYCCYKCKAKYKTWEKRAKI